MSLLTELATSATSLISSSDTPKSFNVLAKCPTVVL